MNILMLGKNSRCLFNAIRRVLQVKEKAMASIVYETIWSWFLRYFDEDKAGVMEAIHKGEYARKLMNPNGKKRHLLQRCVDPQSVTPMPGRI